MAELKAYKIVLSTESETVGGIVYSKKVYDQADVDKVIAKLKDEIHNLKRSLIVARHEVANARGKNFSNNYRKKFKKGKR